MKNEQLEKLVLGAILIDRTAIDYIVDFLKPEMFYIPLYKEIYEHMLIMFNRSIAIDTITVSKAISEAGTIPYKDAAMHLMELSNMVASTAHIETHARSIHELWIKREAIRIGTELRERGGTPSEDAFETLERAEKELYEINSGLTSKKTIHIGENINETLKEIEASCSNHGVTGIKSGLKDLDKLIGGWMNSNMIVLAGRPKMGKTNQACEFLRQSALSGVPSAFFTLEMSKRQLDKRLLALQANVDHSRIVQGYLTNDEKRQLLDASATLAGLPIYIDETPGLTLFQLRGKLRRLKRVGIGFVIIDYVQLMKHPLKGRTRENEVSEISQGIKGLAKELDIPIMALAQLSRDVEKRGGDKKPMLSDLRESGALEQDADQVIFCYRAEYYGLEPGYDTKGILENIVAANRHGNTGTVLSRFEKEISQYQDFETEQAF